MKLFLDDIRTVDDELNYIIVRDYESCVKMISALRNILELISLDYSLGTEKTGYDVLLFMAENRIYPKHINIHSDHEQGVRKMEKFICENFPSNMIVTLNRI